MQNLTIKVKFMLFCKIYRLKYMTYYTLCKFLQFKWNLCVILWNQQIKITGKSYFM